MPFDTGSGGLGDDAGLVTNRAGFLGVDLALTNTEPGEIETNSGADPASATVSVPSGEIISGDAAGEHGTIDLFPALDQLAESSSDNPDAILVGGLLKSNTAIGTANTDFFTFGLIDRLQPDDGQNNITCFNPGAGDSTDGNIRVDDGGSDTDGSISYPTLTTLQYYEVVIDYVDGETRFHVNSHEPIDGSGAAVATLAATTDVSSTSGAGLGIGVVGSNNSEHKIAHLRAFFDTGVL